MKMFDSVVIAHDNSPDCQRASLALRGFLEQGFSLRVQLLHLLWKRQVIEFLADGRPEAQVTILVAHGSDDGADGHRIHFHVMHQENDDYDSTSGWEEIDFALGAEDLRRLVHKGRGTILMSCCEAGGDLAIPNAFLSAGYEYFISTDISPDWAGFLLFTTGLFYYLLAEDLERRQKMSVPDAARRAALLDPDWDHGTKAYRCLARGQ